MALNLRKTHRIAEAKEGYTVFVAKTSFLDAGSQGRGTLVGNTSRAARTGPRAPKKRLGDVSYSGLLEQ